jgi:hypothetical protein
VPISEPKHLVGGWIVLKPLSNGEPLAIAAIGKAKKQGRNGSDQLGR